MNITNFLDFSKTLGIFFFFFLLDFSRPGNNHFYIPVFFSRFSMTVRTLLKAHSCGMSTSLGVQGNQNLNPPEKPGLLEAGSSGPGVASGASSSLGNKIKKG